MSAEIRFTRNGSPVGDRVVREPVGQKVNDIHIKFSKGSTGNVTVEYKGRDGKTIKTRTAPPEAHDVGIDFEWEAGQELKVWRVYWTDEKGKRLKPKKDDPDEVPNTTGVHLSLPDDGKIDAATWTHDSKELGKDKDVYPSIGDLDANDFHFGESAFFPWENALFTPSHRALAAIAERLAFVQGQVQALMDMSVS